MKRNAFTLIELLVVIAMLALLTGAVSSAVMGARRRAKITAATTAVREMTNAILAYENYGKNNSLAEFVCEKKTADESSVGFILGKATENGQKVPVLYNAALKGGKIVDPWGNPYFVTIRKGETVKASSSELTLSSTLQGSVAVPNFYRRRGTDK